MSESAKVRSDVALDKVEFTVGLTLIIWSIVIPTGFLIFFLPPIGAYLIIRSVTNILRAIRDGE